VVWEADREVIMARRISIHQRSRPRAVDDSLLGVDEPLIGISPQTLRKERHASLKPNADGNWWPEPSVPPC
jgi:hypothetical protein